VLSASLCVIGLFSLKGKVRGSACFLTLQAYSTMRAIDHDRGKVASNGSKPGQARLV
jgi:hypothetical protein